MPKTFPLLVVTAAAALAVAVPPPAPATAPPVGPLPPGRTVPVRIASGQTFTATLPKPSVAGGVWRIARPFDARVLKQTAERTTAGGGVAVSFAGVGRGSTRISFALTQGETPRALAARTFAVQVTGRGTGCPRNLLPLTANAVSPAAAAALAADPAHNRPQVTGAMLAPQDTQRGPQAAAQCGKTVWRRTVVVYIVDRAALPAQSASQRVLFVGRTSDGYRVWARAH
jgi:hypothetical protein